MELKVVLDEEKLKEIVDRAIENLKAEGYLYIPAEDDKEDILDGNLCN